MEQEVTLAPCGCENEPVWGYITSHDAQGKFLRHHAIRCLHCHYWFYINGEKQRTADSWNEAARHRLASTEALRAKIAERDAEVARLREAVAKIEALIPMPGNDRQIHGTYAQGVFDALQLIRQALQGQSDE